MRDDSQVSYGLVDSGLMKEPFDVVVQLLSLHDFELHERNKTDRRLLLAPKQQLTKTVRRASLGGVEPLLEASENPPNGRVGSLDEESDHAHYGCRVSMIVSKDH